MCIEDLRTHECVESSGKEIGEITKKLVGS
jgi:hypothetical protein